MERQSNLHSPHVDEQLEHEVSSLTHGAPIEAHVEESRLMEDAGDGEPVAQAIVGELHDAEGGDELAGGLSHAEVLARSELAIHLRPRIFPAGQDSIIEYAEESTPTELLGHSARSPTGSTTTVQEVWGALGSKHEEGSGHVLQEDPHVREDPEAPHKATPVAPPQSASPQQFGFRFDRWHRLAALPFGVALGESLKADSRAKADLLNPTGPVAKL